MKTKLIGSALLSLSILGTLALASCQNGGSAPHAAVACSKCQTVWVKHQHSNYPGGGASKGHFVTLSSSAHMACPDCTNKVESMFKGLDKTTHTCKSCGGSLFHCIKH